MYPGTTKTKNSIIMGMNTEDKVPNEGMVKYDIKFYAYLPNKKNKIKIIVDLEAQKKFFQGYDIVSRGIFYGARLLSAELETEFCDNNYDDIKKVYSIWVCMDCPQYAQNTMTEYSFTQKNIIGEYPKDKNRYDLISVIMIGLPRVKDEKIFEDVGDDLKLHKLLGILFSNEVNYEIKKNILKDEYEFIFDDDMERSYDNMCNLAEGIEEKGILKGLQIGREEGREEGQRALINSLTRLGVKKEQIILNLMEEFELTNDEATSLLK